MAAPPVVGVRVLGPLMVELGSGTVGLGGPKQRAVLAILVAGVGRVVPRDVILTGVWGEDASDAHRGSFHTYVSALRAALGDVIVRDGNGYRLDIPPEDVDAVRFEQTVERARERLASDPEGVADELRDALGMWRGLPYADLIDVPGLQAEIRRLEELRLTAVELRVEADLALGRHQALVAELEALAEEHPLRERFRAQHMLALYRCGRQAEALAAFRRTRDLLGDELGLEPSSELRDLEQRILRQDETLLVDVARSRDTGDVSALPGYELREEIGRGAFGVVLRGYQPSVGREVAIKVVRPELASRPGFVRRFESEARMVARLAHPHVVQLIDFWRDPESAYLVMQQLPGGSLLEVLSDGGVARSAARRMLHQIGEALDHAHGQGVSHGDLKPSNVLLDDAGNAYLSDFGLAARLLDPRSASSPATAPDYRAPEEAASGPSPAADLFALGVLARQLLDREGDVEAVVARATATNPGDRYPTAASFLADLDAALGEEATAVSPTPVSRNPYKGLRAFEEADAADFYGRDELVASLLVGIEEHRFVTVVGPSGSGKSSAVQAGLLPALAAGRLEGSQDWFRVVFTPGTDPTGVLIDALERISPSSTDLAGLGVGNDLAGLAEALLRDVEGDLLLVVDQFEELFTLVDDPDRRAGFIDLLANAVERDETRVRVVATLRADFYDRPLAHDRLDRLVRDGLVTVLRPARDELVDMITRPAQTVGLRWEPGLPHRIAQDVADQPGALPLLQYSLTELVERRSGDLLSADDYDRIGGVEAALARRAETVFGNLTGPQQRAFRQAVPRLVTVDEDSEATRRRVRRSELHSLPIDRADLDTALTTLITERLLLADRDPVTRGPTVEVAHEALLRGWPRLASWIDERRDGLVLGRRFRAAMADWDAAGRDDDYLLTGSRLAPFATWADTWALTGDERAFYAASRAKDEADHLAEARRRSTLTGILATAAVVATVLALVAVTQSSRARTEADRAVAAERHAETEADRASREADRANREAEIARARELAASAINVLDDDPALSKLLALSAASITDPPMEVISTLHQAYAADRVVALRGWPERSPLRGTFHPSGEMLVAAGDGPGPLASDAIELLDFDSGEVLWSHRVDGESFGVGPAFFSPDGEEVVAGIIWSPAGDPPADTRTREQLGIHVWDALTGELRQRFDVGPCGGLVAGASAAGLLVRTLPDESACRWRVTEDYEEVGVEFLDLQTGERRILAQRATVSVDDTPVLSTDGRIAAFDTADGGAPVVRVVETATGETILEFDPSGGTGVRAVNHDGSLLVYGFRPFQIWDVPRGEVVASFDRHPGDAMNVLFDPSDGSVYSTGTDAVLRHWDPLSGDELAVYPGVGAGRPSLVRDGHVHLIDPDARTAAVVDVRSGHRGEVGALETCPGFTAALTLEVVGDLAALTTVCHDDSVGTTHVWDLVGGDLLYTLPGQGGQAPRVSPDGSRFARQDAEVGRTLDDPGWYGGVTIRDFRTGSALLELDGLCTWETAPTPPRAECATFPEAPFGIWMTVPTWSPDGTMIVGLDHPAIDGYLAVWDARTGRLLYTRERPDGSLGYQTALFSPDSKRLFAAHAGAALVDVISTETWELLTQLSVDGSIEGGNFLGLVEFVDEATFVGVGGFMFTAEAGATLVWFDADTHEVVRTRSRIHDGTVKSKAMSPDGTLVATGASDGFARVWDARTGSLVHEIPLGDTQVQGVAFVGERHLAVAPQEGNLLIFAIDTDGLLEIVRSSLTRGFTEAECARFNFDDDCPALADLRRG